jgi:hypothetical protein
MLIPCHYYLSTLILHEVSIKITMKEYEDMAIKVGDKVRIEIRKADKSGV